MLYKQCNSNYFDLNVDFNPCLDLEFIKNRINNMLSSFRPVDIDMSLPPGERLRLIRQGANLTIQELAKQSGVSKTTISNAEKGQVLLRIASAVKIAKVFGVSPGIFNIPDMPSEKDEIADSLKKLRLCLGLKQNEFAKLVQVDSSTVFQSTHPHRVRRKSILQLLCAAFLGECCKTPLTHP